MRQAGGQGGWEVNRAFSPTITSPRSNERLLQPSGQSGIHTYLKDSLCSGNGQTRERGRRRRCKDILLYLHAVGLTQWGLRRSASVSQAHESWPAHFSPGTWVTQSLWALIKTIYCIYSFQHFIFLLSLVQPGVIFKFAFEDTRISRCTWDLKSFFFFFNGRKAFLM